MKYHFIGIGGVSMSGLAKLLISQSHIVSGCDLRDCKIDKMTIFKGHNSEHITKDLDAVVVTSAALHDNSPAKDEIEKARKLGIKIIVRGKLIGQLMNDKVGIAIAGMHGKTTTTAMVGRILEDAGLNPTVLVGADTREWGGNVRVGKPSAISNQQSANNEKHIKTESRKLKAKSYFVAEACEYERQFLYFRPKIAIILNLEEEHLDTYPGGMKEIKQAFKKFIKLLPKNGLLVVNQDDKNLMSLVKAAKCKVKRFGKNKLWPGLKLKIPGIHNLLDATAAARVGHELGVSNKIIKKTLNNFIGAQRRFEIKGEKNHVLVIDDYGHHPTEIQSTIKATREYLNEQKRKGKLIVVFQPHQFVRTKILFNDFVNAFNDGDYLIVNDVYLIAGREPKEARADLSKDLAQKINEKKKVEAEYISGYDEIVEKLNKTAKPGDTILTIGATDIYKVGEKFLK